MYKIRLTAVGDIMLGDQPICYGFGLRSKFEHKYKKLICNNDILREFNNQDIIVGNLEGAFGNSDLIKFSNSNCFSQNAIEYIKSLNFNFLSLANNHSLEKGKKGLEDLYNATKHLEINFIGSQGNNPLIYSVKCKKIIFFAFSTIPDYKNNPGLISLWDITKLKEIGSFSGKDNFIIIFMHWGNEFVTLPSDSQIKIARLLIENGASLVLGCHPHVLQPIERYKNSLIVYSMGNFISDYYFIEETRHSAIFKFDIDLLTKKIKYRIVPLKIGFDYAIQNASGHDREKTFHLLNRNILIPDKYFYHSEVLSRRKKYRFKVIKHVFNNLKNYKDKFEILKWASRRFFIILLIKRKESNDPNTIYKYY